MNELRLDAALELLERLVSFDTTSVLSNVPLIDFAADYLRSRGIDVHIDRSEDGAKANLVASVGPTVPGGVLLSGHTDVVPVAGQAWTHPPFALTRAGDRFYGRGTADMKGFIAVALALLPALRRSTLRVPIHLALSYDEEIGCFGAHRLVEHLSASLPKPAFAIVGEPSGMEVFSRHKSSHGFETTIVGREAHSSRPDLGANAIVAAGALIEKLAGIDGALRRDAGASDFDVPYSTINVAEVAGGTAINIIPNRCTLRWGMRMLPGADAERPRSEFETFALQHVLRRLRETAPEASIETKTLYAIPALAADQAAAARDTVLRLAGVREARPVAYCSEAGIFQRAGIPSLICGPGRVDQAHRPDEFVEMAQLAACAAFLQRIGEWACGDRN